jgi:TonB family protein
MKNIIGLIVLLGLVALVCSTALLVVLVTGSRGLTTNAILTSQPLVPPPGMKPATSPAQPQIVSSTTQGGGSPLPTGKGRLRKQPLRMAVVNDLNPKQPRIVPPDVKLPDCPSCLNYGDPLAKIGPLSNGPGSESGSGGGVGGVFRVGGGVTAPSLLFKVEPEYSEEARKAKYQGAVLLYVQVDPSGKAVNMRVLHSLGLGLDERAMEAVKKWKFKPGVKDGKAVTVEAQIEVNFRLF